MACLFVLRRWLVVLVCLVLCMDWLQAVPHRTQHTLGPEVSQLQKPDTTDEIESNIKVSYLAPGQLLKLQNGATFHLLTTESHEKVGGSEIYNKDKDLGQLNLRWCSHSALRLVAVDATAQQVLQYGKLVVELVIVTNFSFPRNHKADMDTPWYDANDKSYACNFSTTSPTPTSSTSLTYLANEIIPPAFEQAPIPSRVPSDDDLAKVEDEMVDYLKHNTISADIQPTCNNNDNKDKDNNMDNGKAVCFMGVPAKCAVLTRRLALVFTHPHVAVAPFSPDAASNIFVFRISYLSSSPDTEPSQVFVTHPIHASDASDAYPTHQCQVPPRIFETSEIDPAFNAMSVNPVLGDHCTPILHCPFCPQAQNFGLFVHPKHTDIVSRGVASSTTASHFVTSYSMSRDWSTVTALYAPYPQSQNVPVASIPLNGAVADHVITVTAGESVRLVIRALPEVSSGLGNAVYHCSFMGRLISHNRIVNVNLKNGPQYSKEVDGYEIEFEVREEGEYVLELFLSWVYGDALAFVGPEPVLLGPHIGHSWKYCHHRRALLFGSPWVVHVLPPKKEISVWGSRVCSGGSEAGRWVLMSPGDDCAAPVCESSTDGEAVTIHAMGWHGERNPWVWTPYTCHYRFYSASDLVKCADKTHTHWLLINGDSQVRELIEHLHLISNLTDVFGKFASLERPVMVPGLRVTFQFFEYAYSGVGSIPSSLPGETCHPFSRGFWPYLEHFNILPSCNSGRPITEYLPNPVTDKLADSIAQREGGRYADSEVLNGVESDRPDVWVWNPAFAYAAQDMPLHEFEQWLVDAVAYLKAANVIPQSPASSAKSQSRGDQSRSNNNNNDDVDDSDGFENDSNYNGNNTFAGVSAHDCRASVANTSATQDAVTALRHKPIRMLWYAAPFTLSQAHANSKWLTQSRVSLYNALARKVLEQHGVSILDVRQITQSRMEDSWDGLHYMRSTVDDPGHGLVSVMAQQVVINAIFKDCHA